MPLVSVVMPSYNHHRFIADSIESVLQQDFEDFELIIVDDASTDASTDTIARYEAADPRIRFIAHEANSGISRTLNDGIDAAKGKFIATASSDDVWTTDKLTKQLDAVAHNDDLVVWSEGELIGDKGQVLGRNFTEMHKATLRKKSGDIFQELLMGNYIFGPTLFFKRSNLGAIRFDEELAFMNDHKFVLELARNYNFCYIAEPLAKYRIHGSNTIVGSSREVKERRRLGRMERASIYEEMLRQYNRTIPNKTKAEVYANLSCFHMQFGESKKTAGFYLQAIRCNPYSWSILASGVCVLKSVLKNLGVRK